MKKIILAAIAALTLTTGATAKDITKHINVGANQTTLNEKSGTGFNIGYGVTRVFENDIMAAFDLNYAQAEIDGETLNNYGGDIKLGYQVHKDIAVYAMGSGIAQSFNNTEAYGYGVGGGAEYTPFEHFGVGINYLTYSMTAETHEYDFDTVQAYLKVMF